MREHERYKSKFQLNAGVFDEYEQQHQRNAGYNFRIDHWHVGHVHDDAAGQPSHIADTNRGKRTDYSRQHR